MEESTHPQSEEAEIEMLEGEYRQNFAMSDETAREVAEDIAEHEVPAPSSTQIDDERIRRANADLERSKTR